jgi:hypothetical protein
MAAVARALVADLEAVRVCLEAMVLDEDFDAGRVRGAAGVVEVRAQLEARFVRLSPPAGARADAPAAEQWLLAFERMLEDAADPDAQPLDALPWF